MTNPNQAPQTGPQIGGFEEQREAPRIERPYPLSEQKHTHTRSPQTLLGLGARVVQQAGVTAGLRTRMLEDARARDRIMRDARSRELIEPSRER